MSILDLWVYSFINFNNFLQLFLQLGLCLTPLSCPLGTLIICISGHLKSSHRSPIVCSFLLFTQFPPWFLVYCCVFKLHNLFNFKFHLLLILPGQVFNQTCGFNHSKLTWGCFYIFHVFSCSKFLGTSPKSHQIVLCPAWGRRKPDNNRNVTGFGLCHIGRKLAWRHFPPKNWHGAPIHYIHHTINTIKKET